MIQQETITDYLEWRITLPGETPIIFSDLRASMHYANQSKNATIEVRSVLEVRMTTHWEVKT